MASSALQHWTASPTKEGCHWQAVEKIVKHDSWPIQPDILSPPLLRLTSRKLLWLDLQPVDIKSRWRHNWKSAQVVNSHLVCDPTIRQPGFDLPRQQWSLLNRFRTEQGHCGACRRKWRLTDTDPCGETQTMSHIVESCPLTKLSGGLSRLHSADEDAVLWLTSYGSWNAYEKKTRFFVKLNFDLAHQISLWLAKPIISAPFVGVSEIMCHWPRSAPVPNLAATQSIHGIIKTGLFWIGVVT